jgi:hypothetical protein
LKNSDHAQSPERTFETVSALLSREKLFEQVDERLDQAVKTFQLGLKGPLSSSSFNEVITEFIRHVYLLGLPLPRRLSKPEALSEAVFLLHRYYRGGHTEGYDGALLDAMDENLEGLELVLSSLGEYVKEIERGKYINWVFADHVDRLDWEGRRRLVIEYLGLYGDLLPANLRELDPARLVEHLHALILGHVSSMNLLKQVLQMG